MKHFKKSFKSLLIVCLSLMLSITTLMANTNTVSAGNATDGYDVNILHGLGRVGGTSTSLSAIGTCTDDAYKYHVRTAAGGYTANGPTSGTTNVYRQMKQGEVVSADFYYGNQMITLNYTVSSGTNCIKNAIYINNKGVLTKTSDGTTTFPSSGVSQRIAVFAASASGNANALQQRWYNVTEDVAVVYHYNNEHTITVNNVEGTQVTIDAVYDDYYKTAITGGTQTVVSANYTDGLEMAYTLNAGEDLASVGVNIGSSSATCNTVTGVQYLSSSYTFSDTAATGDILSINFDTKKITYNDITSDITVNFIYSNTTTYDVVFMVGGVQYGETQQIVSGDVAIRPTDPSAQTGYVFDYWHTLGSDTAYNFSTPVTDNLTLYGEFIEQYTFTFNGVKAVSSSTWTSKTGGTAFSGSDGVYTATTKGAYITDSPADSTSSGFSLSFDYITSINGASIQVGEMSANIPAEWFAASANISRYLDDQGNWYETFADMTAAGNTPILKLAHNTQAGAEARLFLRLWNMESDITVTTSIGDRKVIFTNFGHGYYSGSGAWLKGNNISFSTWESATGGVLYANPKAAIDEFGEEYHQSMGTVPGDYDNNTGVGGSLKTTIADLDTITFTYGSHTPIVLNVDGGTGIKGKTFYINSNYELEERTAKATGDLFKMATTSTATDTISVRFYKIVEDINIEATYINEHTITIKNYEDHIEAGAFSPSTTGEFVGINCWDPYGISDDNSHTGLRAGGTLDTVNGIATVYGDYSQASGIGAGLKIPTNFSRYNKLIIIYGEETVQYDLSNEEDNSKLFKVGGTDILRVTVYENEDCYYLRFFKIDDDFTIEAKSEGLNDHVVRFENASSASSSTWESITEGIPFSSVGNNNYEASTFGDYVNTTYSGSDGVKAWFGTALGEIETVTFAFNNHTFTLNADDFASSFSNVYVDIEGNQYSDTTTPGVVYAFKVAYTLGDQGFFIRFFNITTDITVTTTYSQYVNVNFVYNDETISSQRILSGTYAEVPEDPASAEGQEFMWYTDAEHTTLFDPEARIYSNVTLYGALASDIHHVYFNGLGFQYRSIQTPPAYLSSSTWVSKTGGFVNTQSGHFVTNGDYSSESGVAVAGRTSNYYVDKVEIKLGDNDPVYLTSNSSDEYYFIDSTANAGYWFLTSAGTLVKRDSKEAGDILRFKVSGKADTAVNVLFYEINTDIQITMMYKMSMKVVINNDGTLDLNVCAYIPKTVRTDKAYVVINDEQVALEDLSYTDYGVGDRLYAANIANLSPKEIADDITLQFFDGHGKNLTEQKTISIKDYLETLAGDDYPCSTQLKTFAKALLNYGGLTQILYDYNTDDLANESLTLAEKNLDDITAETLEPYKAVRTGTTEGITAIGEALTIKDGTDFRVYFTTENSIDNYTFMDGTHELTAKRSGTWKGVPCYYVTIPDVAAPDLTTMHDISVKYQNTGDYVVSCNVLTYVGLAIRDNDEYTQPMKALYRVGTTASSFKSDIYSVVTSLDEYTPYDGEKLKIAFIGDSITFGYASTNPAENSYPAVLAELLGNKYEIGNFGMSGSYVIDPYTYSQYSSYVDQETGKNSNENKYYLNTIQYENSKAFEPDVVIIMEGTNDQRSIARYGDPAKAAFKKCLSNLVKDYQSLPSVKKVYVMTSIVVHVDDTIDDAGLSYNMVADGILCDLQTEVANNVTNCGLIDLHHATYSAFNGDNYASYFAADHLHPNNTGYRLIAETICDILTGNKKLLSFVSYDTNDKVVNKDLFYTNVNEEWGADPTIIYVSDTNSSEYGYYYMYATSGYVKSNGIQAWRSRNLTDWECMGVAFAPDTDGDWAYEGIWAPSVIYNEESHLYYLFYSAVKDTKVVEIEDEEKTEVYRYDSYATSSNPYGPFTNSDYKTEPMLVFEDHKDEITDTYWIETYKTTYENATGQKGYMKVIGPRAFIDTDGKTYLFFCADLDYNGYNAPIKSCIYAMRLNLVNGKYIPDYSTVTKITEYGKKKFPESYTGQYNITEDGLTNEGPICFKYGNKYYLTFITSNYMSEKYQTRLAVADSPLGPYTKIAPYEGGVVAKTYAGMQRRCIGIRDIIKIPGTGDSNYDRYYAAYMTFWNNETYDPQNVRKFAIDELVPITNDSGTLVFQINGPSTTPQDLPLGISGYKDLAQLGSSKLTVSSSSANSSIELLSDGLVPYSDKYLDFYTYAALNAEEKLASKAFAAKPEYVFTESKVTITYTFTNYVDLRAVMVYNSKDDDKKFERVDSVVLSYKKNNQTGDVTITPLKYNTDNDISGKLTIGGACIAEFADIAVNKVVITISKPSEQASVGIPEIKLLGKEAVSSSVLYGTTGALYDPYVVGDQSVTYNDWKNVDSQMAIDCVKEDEYQKVVSSSGNYTVYTYKGSDGVYIYADVIDANVATYKQEIYAGHYNVYQDSDGTPHGHMTFMIGDPLKTSLDSDVKCIVVDVFNETFRYLGSGVSNTWVRCWFDASSKVQIKNDNSGFIVEVFIPYYELGVTASDVLKMNVVKSNTSISSKDPSAFKYDVE